MRLLHPLWRHVFFTSVITLLWACSSRAQSVHFQLSDSNSSSATLTGRFTPTVFVPAMSNLLVTIAGLHVFPGDAISIQASVSIPDQNGGKMRVEKYNSIGQTDDYFSALTQNDNFKANNPSSRSWTSEMRYTPTDPNEDFFGRRITGAFCPTISGVYQMVLADVDDYAELWIARENPNTRSLEWTGAVIKETLGADFASRRPVRRDFAMEANKIYPFINIFVEKTGSDQMIFSWRKPGDSSDSAIPTDAFCTGWSSFHGGVLRVLFPFFLLPDAEVTFTVQTLPNPSCPRLANAQIASAISVPDYQGVLFQTGGIVQSSASGSYPSTFYGENLCKLGVVLSVSDTSAAIASLTGRFTPTEYIPAFSSLVVTLAGSNVFPAGSVSLPAHVQVSNTQTGSKNVRVEKFILENAIPFRDKLLAAANYQSNNPHSTIFEYEIQAVQTNPGEDHFGKRFTGAFCPTLPGDLYSFVLEDVDDFAELHIAQETSNSFTQVFTQPRPTFTTKPLYQTFSMQAGKIYPFFAIFVEATGEDFMKLKWRTPGSSTDEVIPPSAFCTGWSHFNSGILQVYSPFAMLPGVEVTFSIQTLPNPFCPRSANTNVSSAILVPGINLMNSASSSVQSTSSITYPDRSLPASSLVIKLGTIDKSRVLNISITSPVPLPSSATFVITLSGTGFVFEGGSVSFVSPAGSSATANLSVSPLVLCKCKAASNSQLKHPSSSYSVT
jgi:hypothetical protein